MIRISLPTYNEATSSCKPKDLVTQTVYDERLGRSPSMEKCDYCKKWFDYELKTDEKDQKICGSCYQNELMKARTKSGLLKGGRRPSKPILRKARSGPPQVKSKMSRPIPPKIIFKPTLPHGDLDALIEQMKKDYKRYDLHFIKPAKEMMKDLGKAWVRAEGAKDMWFKNFNRNMRIFLLLEEYADKITEFIGGVSPALRVATFTDMEARLQNIVPPDEEGQQVAANPGLANDLNQLHEHFMGLRDLVMRWYEIPVKDKVNFILEVIAHEKGYQISLNALERYRSPSKYFKEYIQIHLKKQSYFDIWTGWQLEFGMPIEALIKNGWNIAIKDNKDGKEKKNSDPQYPQYRTMWLNLLTWLDQAMMHWRPKPRNIDQDIGDFTLQLKEQSGALKKALVFESRCMKAEDVDQLLGEEIYNVLLWGWAQDEWEKSAYPTIKRGELSAEKSSEYLKKIQGFVLREEEIKRVADPDTFDVAPVQFTMAFGIPMKDWKPFVGKIKDEKKEEEKINRRQELLASWQNKTFYHKGKKVNCRMVTYDEDRGQFVFKTVRGGD